MHTTPRLLNQRFLDLGISPLFLNSPLTWDEECVCPRKPPYTYAHTHIHTHIHNMFTWQPISSLGHKLMAEHNNFRLFLFLHFCAWMTLCPIFPSPIHHTTGLIWFFPAVIPSFCVLVLCQNCMINIHSSQKFHFFRIINLRTPLTT